MPKGEPVLSEEGKGEIDTTGRTCHDSAMKLAPRTRAISTLGIILIVLLILALGGGGYMGGGYAYGPGGLLIVVLIILLVMGKL